MALPISDWPISDWPISDGPISDGPISDGPISDYRGDPRRAASRAANATKRKGKIAVTPFLEEMLDPTGRGVASDGARLAPRTHRLAGTTVGLLNNAKPNSAVLLEQFGALLEAQHGVAHVVSFAKPSFAVPAGDALLAKIAERCDYVLAGIGD